MTTTRTRSEAERREQILGAARAVFDEKGYESATVADIVKRAGVAQGTFYLYFPTKRDVVIELARKPMGLVAQRLRSKMTAALSFEDSLRAVVQTGFDVACEYPDLCRLIHLGVDTIADAKATDAGREMRALGEAMFRQAAASGEMEPMDPVIAFESFETIMSGAMQRAFADSNDDHADEIAKAVEDLVLRAFVRRS